eukprot:gene17204-biopygen5319
MIKRTSLEPRDTSLEPRDTSLEPKDTCLEPRETKVQGWQAFAHALRKVGQPGRARLLARTGVRCKVAHAVGPLCWVPARFRYPGLRCRLRHDRHSRQKQNVCCVVVLWGCVRDRQDKFSRKNTPKQTRRNPA